MNAATHYIPTIPCPYNTKGHFKSEATLIIEGASRDGGPGGWRPGGWNAEGEGRVVFQGPMVKGPVGYIFGLCLVLSDRGGTGAEHREAESKGLMFRVKAGDILVLDGMSFTLSLDSQRYPHLTAL